MGKQDSVQYASVKMVEDDEALAPMDIKSTRDVSPRDWKGAFWWVFAITPYVILVFLLILGSTGNLYEVNDESCAAQRMEKLQMTRNVYWDQSVVSDATRYAAIGQKGATIWMTGLSGSGKSTIGRALESELIHRRLQVYRLDGDNVRIGLNRDLGFSAADRAESVRRVGEVAALFASSGTITIVGLVSPYREHRDEVRELHKKMNIPFYEIFVDTPLEVVMARDIKGLYKKAVEGKIQHFTGISAPYEAPLNPDMTIFTPNMTLESEVDVLLNFLKAKGLFTGVKELPQGYPGVAIADGGNAVENFTTLYPDIPTPPRVDSSWPRVLLRDEDLHWLQVIGEGWAAPLRGFMREGAYLQCLHFSSVVFDSDNLTAGRLDPHAPTNFSEYSNEGLVKGSRVNLPVPIVLPITAATKAAVNGVKNVVLVDRSGREVAILSDPEVYDHRKEERITRTFGAMDSNHPYIASILKSGDYLLGGEIELLNRITYNDGLDQYRLTPAELRKKFEDLGADAVLAFQTRNPTHAGHAYLMNTAREHLLKLGYKKPILWLSPLGGWTKDDDVPLNVRVNQHVAIINDKMLDPESTVLSIWPSPMVYAGPREVQWHAKSRKNAGASYFVVGRDPAGIKRSDRKEDMYAGDHGRYVLHLAPGMEDMNILSFSKVYYDVTDHKMKPMEAGRSKRDFLSISGTRMRLMAKLGLQPCNGEIPMDWESNPTCVPPGFMAQSGWDLMIQYYQQPDAPSNIQFAVPFRTLPTREDIETSGVLGTRNFALYLRNATTKFSAWHDIPLYAGNGSVNFVVEIEKGRMEKMEVNKKHEFNAIMQDTTKFNSTRYYMYGVPFFNYGMLPQTWEDPSDKDEHGHGGDNDPLDVIEVGNQVLPIGSVNPVRVLGSLELIDQDEIDHKIIAISLSDPDAPHIHNANDLMQYKPHVIKNLIDWLRNYKLPEGKPENVLAQDTMTSPEAADEIISKTHESYIRLKRQENSGFWLG
ncbi:APS kinase/ATP sulfurlyase/pyrophosphatase fusion protein [Thraustotheca clavata]|uniref:APS kinase/ATP sulfurlyase/pyrophosphatase fusion protein n=1 Tax=Thraustotheca clavata TaxID=74557 RepID=A0A1W0A888_9STRA|nr:APS kinase/ATP sulfurlyase/pyrophosphatase fusion protein [Thraustotheca clavata]